MNTLTFQHLRSVFDGMCNQIKRKCVREREMHAKCGYRISVLGLVFAQRQIFHFIGLVYFVYMIKLHLFLLSYKVSDY